MTDHLTNDDRERLITGDEASALSPDEAAEVSLLADVLANPSTWAEPPPELEDAVIRAVSSAPATAAPTHAARRRRRLIASALVAAAAVFAIAIVATIALTGGGSTANYAAELRPTELASDARATADIVRTDAGFRITLDARGLPTLQPGEFYQAWLKNDAGALVPVGTFSSSDDRVTLWSGVSPKQFSMITVTIEANDNDQTSSGRRVLLGDVRARRR